MIHTKRVIFMILPLLFVPLVYGMSSTPDACAVPPDPNFGSASASCSTDADTQRKTCCWYLPDGKTIRCQSCFVGLTGNPTDCTEVKFEATPTPSPFVSPEDGVLEQPLTATPPPLFGENTNVPPTAGIEQQPTTTTPQIPPRLPGGGAGLPTEGGSAEQPPASQDDQNDNQGGGLPTIKGPENVAPDSDITEQPDDDGQEDSSEGAETAGPLT
ncbi:MAG TPA: hypothetical protein VFR94_17490 [Nitrososphaeraceae archaeon]|nr:hypothetical protein [Nitrososphaeraceae archaeon]